MMTELIQLLPALLVGMLLGTLFFGGLWLTIQKIMTSKYPALWSIGSFLVRISLVTVVFFFVSDGRWQPLLVCLAGFLMGRVAVLRLTKSVAQRRKEVRHAA